MSTAEDVPPGQQINRDVSTAEKKKNGVPRRPTLAVDGWWHPCGILMIMPQMLLAGWMFGPRTDLSMFKNFVDGCLLFSPFGWFGGNFDMFLLRF